MDQSNDEDGKPAARPSFPLATGLVTLDANDDTTAAAWMSSSGVEPNEGQQLLGELPFLVTHWLAGYHRNTAGFGPAGSEEQTKAMQTIERAATDLAAAFATLGAFGTASRPLTGQNRDSNPLTYHDMKRMWSSCPMDQLQYLLQSNQSASVALDRVVQVGTDPNQVQASTEALQQAMRNPDEHGGRTLQDQIVGDGTSDNSITAAAIAGSALQKPVLFASDNRAEGPEKPKPVPGADMLAIPARSCVTNRSQEAASAMRNYLDIRAKSEEEAARIRSLKQSLDLQRVTLATLERQMSDVLRMNQMDGSRGESEATAFIVQLDEIKNGKTNCERVIAQLELQLPTLQNTHCETLENLVSARERAIHFFSLVKTAMRYYRDPLAPRQSSSCSNNRILLNASQRQLGIDRYLGRGVPRSMARIRNNGATLENRRALLYNRFSYAATINTHLSYPVYCLRFDRSGRYFITGADDYLVKVFCIGGSLQLKKKHTQMNPASYSRGAVLVCTLKGHAGVINDIEVSSDNSFLATASEDGDCRVWGLSDGCPVAILRGHAGGANMVSWSSLTPYRLVTTGADGLARTWDIREACLKRYGRLVGNRPEYMLQVNGKDLTLNSEHALRDASSNSSTDEIILAPRVPVRDEASSEHAEAVLAPVPAPVLGSFTFIPPPPLPQAATALVIPPLYPGGDPNNDQIQLANDGQFVANDKLDVGVKLVSKLQHGATHDERMGGIGTRAMRSAVKVICVSHCPYGGHFATGSDDGICRVWREESNSLVEKADSHFHNRSCLQNEFVSRPVRRSADRLLLTLKGHLSAITDLKYSNQGDRLLTASQKDGVVRLWAWKTDPALMTSHPLATDHLRDTSGREISHILLKLTNPNSVGNCVASTRQGPRSRASRNLSHSISCDCAVWLRDDTKVVTSQSELAKQNGAEIVPGSQYLFLWDSFTGHCLLGISGGHSAQCPVVLPHPLLTSIMCTAAADGTARVWDWANGKCVYSHTNTGDFGPIDATDRGKCCGYLDGDFSPDGTNMVLADDSGRVTVFDCNVPLHGGNGESGWESHSGSFPDWMKEQYFSNDYYDLFYDLHGYCVERGSEMPPHLAPKGARCSHLGAPFSAMVNETFKGLAGPIPLEENAARWHRTHLRRMSSIMLERKFTAPGNLVRQFDPKTCRVLHYGASKSELLLSTDATVSATPRTEPAQVMTPPSSARRLSSNYRWIGINDVHEDDEEGNEQESDDEEFELGESRRDARARTRAEGVATTAAAAASQDSDSDDELEYERIEPSRASSRHRRRPQVTEEDDDDMDLMEYLSTNNNPTGPFVADYNAHFFKMNSSASAGRVKRDWVRRTESTSSYEGRKKYTPQIGDSVVYIPRAHFETISEFPNLETPWQSWPEGAAWPVVECCVRNIRYRFPFKDFWNGTGSARCDSVVAIVTLEITGIPQLSSRDVGWPSPTFTAPTRAHVFELSIFENSNSDFVVPLHLYVSRLRQLEQAYQDTHGDVSIEAYFAETDEDAQFVSWIGCAVDFSEDPDNGQEQSHPSLSGSGYNSVRVVWEDESEDTLSPWEVALKDAMPPRRPSLTEDEKRTIRRALKTVKALPMDAFRSPVDESQYSDYRTRVEVPMDLTFITTRLEADYYSTKYSVVADVRLVQTNCAKYNGDYDDLTELAGNLVATFEDNVLCEEEKAFFHEYELPISGLPLNSQGDGVDGGSELHSPPIVIQRRTERLRRPPRSVLEDIAGSSPDEVRVSRANRALRTFRPGGSRVQITESSSLVAAAQQVVAPTLEQLSSNNLARGRTTRARHNSQRAASHRGNVPQRSVRASLRNAANRNHSWNAEEEALERSNAPYSRPLGTGNQGNGATHHSLRPGLRNSQSRDSSPSDEEGHSNQLGGRISSRATFGSVAQEERRRPRIQIHSARHALTAGVTDVGEFHDEEMGQMPARESSGRSTRNSAAMDSVPETSSRLKCRRTRAGTKRRRYSSDDASSAEESVAEKSDSEEDFDVKSHSTGSESDISVEADRDRSKTVSTRLSRAQTKRSRASKVDDESIGSAENGRKKVSQNCETDAHGCHARSTRHIRKSYVDPSESEFGSDIESTTSVTPPLKQRRGSSGSKKALKSGASHAKSKGSPPRKRKRVKEETRRTQIENTLKSLNLSKWPEIPVRHISMVAHEILERLRNLDEAGNFLVPVVESFPDIADDYLDAIAVPMDFRTIVEERLNVYQSIAELQDDLILVFSNCMEFNVPESDLYVIAQSTLESLEEIFLSTCDDLGVRPLHHRSR